MSTIARLDEARDLVAGADRSPFQDMPRAYRWPAMWHRAMMVAFFWHEEMFQRHADSYLQFVEWAFLDERRKAR